MQPAPLGAWLCLAAPKIKSWKEPALKCLREPLAAATEPTHLPLKRPVWSGGTLWTTSKTGREQGREGRYAQGTALPVASGLSSSYPGPTTGDATRPQVQSPHWGAGGLRKRQHHRRCAAAIFSGAEFLPLHSPFSPAQPRGQLEADQLTVASGVSAVLLPQEKGS